MSSALCMLEYIGILYLKLHPADNLNPYIS